MHASAKHPSVDAEIRAAAGWYEERCPGLGVQFVEAIRQVSALIDMSPQRYAIRFADIRRAKLARFPYSIWYCFSGNRVHVLSVLHNKREHRALLAQRRPDN